MSAVPASPVADGFSATKSALQPRGDEALSAVLARYAALAAALTGAAGVWIGVREGGEAQIDARHGRFDPEAEADRTVSIGDVGRLALFAADGAPLRTDGALDHLVALLRRELGGGVERRAAREAGRAAAVEVTHQMRNAFAKVNALIDLAAREDAPPGGLARTAKRRIGALAEANEVAMTHGFGALPFAEVIEAGLAACLGRAGPPERLVILGDPLTVSPAAASVLAPLIAEIAADAGRREVWGERDVTLGWRVIGDLMVLRWREGTPDETAFAGPFLREVGPRALGGNAHVSHEEDGVTFELRVPLAVLRIEGESRRT